MTHDALTLLVELALKSTAVAGFALLIVTGLRRLAAAEKHLVLGAALVALLLLPLASVLLPRTPLSLRIVRADLTGRLMSASDLPKATEPSATVAVSKRVQTHRAAAKPMRRRGAISGSPFWEAPTLARLLTAAYLAVAALLLGYFLFGAWRVARLVRSLDAVPASSTRQLAERLARDLGVRRPIRLLQSPSDNTPWAWGLRRGVIVLPERFDTWPADAQRNAIVHELAHIRRFDLPTAVLGHVCCALYWFQPLCWWLVRRMRREAESACDDCVLLFGAGRAAYAGQLLDIARKIYRDGRRSPLVSAMAGRSFVSRRIESILDARMRRRTVSKYKMTGVLVVALAMLVPLAGLKSQEPGAAGARLDDPAFQALLKRGPANDGELARIVATLLANGMQSRATQALAEWIARDSATGATCGLCIDALRNDSRPRSKLTATVLNAFDLVENRAFQDHDGKLLLRLAQLSLAGRNSDATDRGLAYLLEAKRVGNAGDLRPTELQYFVSIGRFDAAKAVAAQLNEDASSTYYHSKRAQMWTRYIDSRQAAASRISTLLLNADTATSTTQSSEYIPLYKPAPAYPAKAAKQHEEGSVIVEYTVTPMGRTKDVHVFRSTNDDFNLAAVASAKEYRYLPRLQSGVAVDVPGVRTKITFAMQ